MICILTVFMFVVILRVSAPYFVRLRLSKQIYTDTKSINNSEMNTNFNNNLLYDLNCQSEKCTRALACHTSDASRRPNYL